VNTLTDAAFGFLGFDLRRVRKREKDGYFVLMTPKKKARKAIKAKIRETIVHGGALTVEAIVKKIVSLRQGCLT
jgi:RNA-directed DNA polymerase